MVAGGGPAVARRWPGGGRRVVAGARAVDGESRRGGIRQVADPEPPFCGTFGDLWTEKYKECT